MSFNTFAEFEGASGPTQIEDFDDLTSERNFTTDDKPVGDLTFSLDQKVEEDLSVFNRILIGPSYPSGFKNAATTNSIDKTSNFAHVGLKNGDVFTLLFDEPMYSFGADFGGLNDSFQRTLFKVDGTLIDVPVTEGPRRRFFGVVSDTPFSSISITGSVRAPEEDSEGFGLDNVRYSSLPPPTTEVPVPASLPLMATSLVLVGLCARRAKRQSDRIDLRNGAAGEN